MPPGSPEKSASKPANIPTGFERRLIGARQIYILPTAPGLAFGLLLVLMVLASANYNNGLGYLLSFLLASLALVSLLHTQGNLLGLSLRSASGEGFFAGTEGSAWLVVENHGGRARPSLIFRYRIEQGMELGIGKDKQEVHLVAVDIPARETKQITLPVTTEHRGWVKVTDLTIATRYPFGLFRAWHRAQARPRTVAYPIPRGDAPPPAGPDSRGDHSAPGAGLADFAGLKDYAPGDSPRHIHWKASARGHEPQVKQWSGGRPAEVRIAWDHTQGDEETRLQQLSAWVVSAEKNQCIYELVMPGGTLGPDCGSLHEHRCLRALALHGLPTGE